MLSSSNPAAASVPLSVTVPPDETLAPFTITTTAVGAATPVTISATYRTTASAVIVVNPTPAVLDSLTLKPTSVNAGTSSTGTVTLTAAAPAGGVSLSLSSNQQPEGVALLPSSVTVPQGVTSATFIVTTFRCKPGSAAISATYAGTTRSADLTVAPTTSDAVTIQRARYQPRQRTLKVDATSTDWTAHLSVYVWSGGQIGSYIGELGNPRRGSYQGQFSPLSVYPPSIIVMSTSCGLAAATATDPPPSKSARG